MDATLFPDLFAAEMSSEISNGREMAASLECIDTEVLAINSDRDMVLRRLRRAGITRVGDLCCLHRGEIAEWPRVGKAFLNVLDEIRREVNDHAVSIIRHWHERYEKVSFVLADGYPVTASSTEEKAEFPGGEKEMLAYRLQTLENIFVAIIRRMAYRRPQTGEVARRYFLEGLVPDVIVRVMGLPSRVAVRRILEHGFLRPLLNGDELCGLSLSEEVRQEMQSLRATLLFVPLDHLEALSQMLPDRFLAWLRLTVMTQTRTEKAWAGDLVVPESNVRRSRRVLQQLLLHLQWIPGFVASTTLNKSLSATSEKEIVSLLLQRHPWIEKGEQGVRLVSEQLHYDYCRIARLLYDADRPLSKEEVLMIYERCYFERPCHLTPRLLHKHYGQNFSIDRGAWSWKKS